MHNFSLVLDGKASKEIPDSSRLVSSETFPASNFASSDPEDNASGLLKKPGRSSFVENIIRNCLKPCEESLGVGSDILFWFTAINKFGSFDKHFAIIARLSKLHFRCTRLIFLVQKEEMIYIPYAAVQADENHGGECGLTCYL